MQTTADSAALEERLSGLLKESKTLKAKLRAEGQDSTGPKNASLLLARKALRNVYLKLLFNHPFSSRTGGVDVDIWTETTYPSIQTYRSILGQLEKQIKSVQQKSAQNKTTTTQQGGRPAPSSVSDAQSLQKQEAQWSQRYARVASAFRAYLAEEEEFWCELLCRIIRVFDVEDAKPLLQGLGISSERNLLHEGERDTSTGLERIQGADAEGGHLAVQGKAPANRQRLLEVINKGLISCGDLARYREAFKEEKAPLPPPPPSHRGGKRGGRGGGNSHVRSQGAVPSDSKNKKRDYSRAAQFYEQAGTLLPTHGHPSNQLAVLATYEQRPFTAVFHYYRALCVAVPFDRAKQNLEKLVRRSVDEWEAQGSQGSSVKPEDDVEKRKQSFLRDLVALHGLFLLPVAEGVPLSFLQHCHQSMSTLVADKILAADTIVQISVAAVASLWTRRLWRSVANKEEVGGAAPISVNTEQEVLLHLTGIMTVLLGIGASETREAMELVKRHPPTDPGSSDPSAVLTRNITAVLRRMLPALRIISKWLKSHVEYLERSRSFKLTAAAETSETATDSQEGARIKREVARAITDLWTKYVDFINVLHFAFPFERLPKLGLLGQSGMTSLNFEEDRDMRGFVPMKKAMPIDARNSVTNPDEADEQLHPNEEHLIRIADLLIDAKVVAEADTSPIAFDDHQNHFYLPHSQADSSLAKSSAIEMPIADYSFSRSDDSKWENLSESTEDAVDLAMRAVDERRRALGETGPHRNGLHGDDGEGEEDDEDGEIILIPSTVPRHQNIRTEVVTAPPSAPSDAAATTASSDVAAQEPQTAQHLFLQMLNGGRKASHTTPPSTTASQTPPPPLLFGGITSSTSRGSHHGGAWDGNEAMQFMNEQQRQPSMQTTGKTDFGFGAFAASSPWAPNAPTQRGSDWR